MVSFSSKLPHIKQVFLLELAIGDEYSFINAGALVLTNYKGENFEIFLKIKF